MNEKEIIKNLEQELRKGSLTLAVISQLFQKHYGYSLVETLNNKGIRIDQNTLYPLLRRLEEQSILVSSWDLEDSRPRKYYQISDLGEEIYHQLKKIYLDQNKTLSLLLEENE